MDYPLAKELQEAGFPQQEANGFVGLMNEGEGDCAGRAYFPTLSELIAACWDGEHELILRWRSESKWSAEQQGKMLGGTRFEMGTEIYDCDTPEEAVARLWIALNPPQEKEV